MLGEQTGGLIGALVARYCLERVRIEAGFGRAATRSGVAGAEESGKTKAALELQG